MFVKIKEERIRIEDIKTYGSGKTNELLIDDPYYIYVQFINDVHNKFIYFNSEEERDMTLEDLDSLLVK